MKEVVAEGEPIRRIPRVVSGGQNIHWMCASSLFYNPGFVCVFVYGKLQATSATAQRSTLPATGGKPIPQLMETLQDIEIVASHRPDVLDPLADVLIMLTGTSARAPDTSSFLSKPGTFDRGAFPESTKIGDSSPEPNGAARKVVFNLLTQWLLYGRTRGGAAGLSHGETRQTSAQLSADTVMQQVCWVLYWCVGDRKCRSTSMDKLSLTH